MFNQYDIQYKEKLSIGDVQVGIQVRSLDISESQLSPKAAKHHDAI